VTFKITPVIFPAFNAVPKGDHASGGRMHRETWSLGIVSRDDHYSRSECHDTHVSNGSIIMKQQFWKTA
jgi:hypothetical protein